MHTEIARLRLAGIALAASVLAGCAMTPEEKPAPVAAAVPPSFETERLIGKWGIASYRAEKDRRRTEAQARAQCRLPYTIVKGPTDGIMIHVADDATIRELKLKGSAAGKTYLGFEGPPGDRQDREILSFSDNVVVMKYVDPEVDNRYGTFVYVRCPS